VILSIDSGGLAVAEFTDRKLHLVKKALAIATLARKAARSVPIDIGPSRYEGAAR